MASFTSCRSYYSTAGYNCVSGNCTATQEDADYLTLTDCEADCGSGNNVAGYNCVSGNCSYVTSAAQYSTYADCQSNCGNGNSSGYDCTGGACTYVNSGADYSNLQECQTACATINAKGKVVLWSSLPEYGFGPPSDTRGVCRVNNMHFTISGNNYTIFAGHHTSTPQCGAQYCETVSLPPGTYTITGKCYFIKPLTGPDCPNYSVTKTVTIVRDQCTPLHFP